MRFLLVLTLTGMAKSFNWLCQPHCGARKPYHLFKLREWSVPNKTSSSKAHPSVWMPEERSRSNSGQRPKLYNWLPNGLEWVTLKAILGSFSTSPSFFKSHIALVWIWHFWKVGTILLLAEFLAVKTQVRFDREYSIYPGNTGNCSTTNMLTLAKWGSQNKDSRGANSREESLSLKGKSAKVERHVEKKISASSRWLRAQEQPWSQRNVAVSNCTKLHLIESEVQVLTGHVVHD